MRARGSTGPKPFFAALGVAVLGIVWFVGALTFFNTFFIYPLFLIFVGVVGMVANAGGLIQRQSQVPPQAMPFAAPPQQPMYVPQQPVPQPAPSSPWCWRCGRPNEGRPVCASCGAAQYAPPPQPMAGGVYSATSGYPPMSASPSPQPSGYPSPPGYPPAQPPAAGSWPQPPQSPPQQPPQRQGW